MTDNAAIRAADKIWQLGPSKPAGEMTEIDLERLKESHAAIIASQYAPLMEAVRELLSAKDGTEFTYEDAYDLLKRGPWEELRQALAAVEDSDEHN